jgi:hypothetical protein
MTGATGPGTAGAPISATIGSATNSQIAVGTDIRLQANYFNVTLSADDPAALERVADHIDYVPIPGRVVAVGKDFPNLVGRDPQVTAARAALATRQSVAVFGVDGIGKSVLLRHLASRVGEGFSRGIALVSTQNGRWQDVGQLVVKSFYTAKLEVQLGPAELRRKLTDLDVLVLLDDVGENADIGQLYALLAKGTVAVASTKRLLAGDARAIRLEGLGDAGSAALIQATLDGMGLVGAVDAAAATRIGRALGGHPSRIVDLVTDADGRHITLAQLADELEAAGGAPVAAAALTPEQASVVTAVASLDGAPAGPEHIAAAAGVATDVVDKLADAQRLRAASPQLRLSVDLGDSEAPGAASLDEVRERFLAHFVRWANARRSDPRAVGEESRAILALLRWADRTNRYAEVVALAGAADAGLASSGRWGAWSEATQYRLHAAESLGDGRQQAVAINQLGIQALGDDDAVGARDLFAKARDRAGEFGLSRVAAVAERNRRVIDLALGGPSDDEPDRDDGNDPGPKPPRPTPPRRWPVVVGGAAIVLVAILAALFLTNRKAIAIEPTSQSFDAAAVDADGERVTFHVTNEGSAALEALDVRLVGANADEFFIVGGDCPGVTLPANATCTVDVLFHPTRPGAATASLSVEASDGTDVTAAIDSLANPITPEPTLPPTPPPSAPPSVTPEPARLADIVIEAFSPTDPPRRGEDLVAVPVHIAVKNVGDGPAGRFPIVITADGVPVPFRSPEDAATRLVTTEPLGVGDVVAYDGSIYLPAEARLDAIQLIVAADSCDAKGATPDDCPVKDKKPTNNSYPLQAADIVVSNLEIQPPRGGLLDTALLLPDVVVDVSFDVTNAGHEPTGDFWIAAHTGQGLGLPQFDQAETDRGTRLARATSLKRGDSLHVTGSIAIPRTNTDLVLAIEAGCPPGSGACAVPEIAFDNNEVVGSLPVPPEPTPTPTPTPVIIY